MPLNLLDTSRLNIPAVTGSLITILVLSGCVSMSQRELYGQCDSSASYSVKLDSTWSASTHPDDFPKTPHYSELIGASHNSEISFWKEGQLASEGLRDVAELGKNTKFKQEIEHTIKRGNAKSVLVGPDIKHSPGSASMVFSIFKDHSKVTLLSMIAPSPDWFVGVSGIELCENSTWVLSKRISLKTYDAGTDSGLSYTAKNKKTFPRAPIAELTSGIHNEKGFIPRFATLTFTLIKPNK